MKLETLALSLQKDDGAISVWLHGSETTAPAGVSIDVKNTKTDELVPAVTVSSNTSMSSGANRKLLLGTFESKKDTEYEIRVSGLSPDRKISLSNTSVGGLMSNLGMAIIGPIIFGFLALIFGIIGLIKLLSSKKAPVSYTHLTLPTICSV